MQSSLASFEEWVNQAGYAGVFVATMAGNLGLPALGSAVIVLMLRYLVTPEWWIAAMVAVAGETTGQLVQYGVARFGRGSIAASMHTGAANATQRNRFDEFYRRYGSPAVLLCRFIPGVKAFSGFPAGAARMPFEAFLGYTFLGTSICWLVLGAVLHSVSGRSMVASRYAREYAGIVFVLLIAFAIIVTAMRRLLRKMAASR